MSKEGDFGFTSRRNKAEMEWNSIVSWYEVNQSVELLRLLQGQIECGRPSQRWT